MNEASQTSTPDVGAGIRRLGSGRRRSLLRSSFLALLLILCAQVFTPSRAFGQLGGFFVPHAIGYLNDRTHSLTAGFACIGFAYLVSSGLLVLLRIEDPSKMLAQAPVSKSTIGSMATLNV